jgi:hypothetical protein
MADTFACTYCGGTKFYNGPSGGISQNILCANDDCRHWFNDHGFTVEDLHKVEPTPDEHARELAELRNVQDEANQKLHDLGVACYREGRSARELFLPYRTYTYPQKEFMHCLMGFLDAMASDIRSKGAKY